jgi:hypothetical protein
MGEREPAVGVTEAPPLDPDAIRREYTRQRAKRKARAERTRRRKRAGARFWIVLLALVGCAVAIGVVTWQLIGDLFGL